MRIRDIVASYYSYLCNWPEPLYSDSAAVLKRMFLAVENEHIKTILGSGYELDIQDKKSGYVRVYVGLLDVFKMTSTSGILVRRECMILERKPILNYC